MKDFLKKSNNPFFQNGYMLLLSALCIVSVSFAWFVSNTRGDVESFDFTADSAPVVLFSADGEHYVETIEVTHTDKFVPLSGDGLMSDAGINLWKPTVDDATETADFTSAIRAAGTEYLTVDYYFELRNINAIYLGSNSSVAPYDKDGDLSPFGNFSRDYIAGAVRVGFYLVTGTDENESEELVFVWIPNPEYELSVNTEDKSRTFNPEGTAEASYSYYNGSEIVNTDSSFITSMPSKLVTVADPEKDTKIHMRLRLWIEGTDREADAALSGGKFNLNLELVSMSE